MKHIYNVEIKQVSLGWNKQGVFVISENGEYFIKPNDEIRSFKNPSGAVTYLRNCCKKYSSMRFVVTMPDGKIKEVGEEELSEDEFGPHEWSKKNSMTIMDGTSSYDIYTCKFCNKEEKAYGLSGHSKRSGACPENPIE